MKYQVSTSVYTRHGETAIHGYHYTGIWRCACLIEELARPWVGVYVPLACEQ